MGLLKHFMKMTAGKRESGPPFIVVRAPEQFGRTIAPADSQRLCDTRALHAQQTVIMDCSTCRYIDSNGIGLLVELRNEVLGRGANIVLAAPTDRVRKVIEVTRLHRVFAIYDSVDAAVAACSQGRASDACAPDAAA